MTLRARLQVRDTVTIEEDETTNEVNLKTLRLVLSGHVLDPKTKYTVQLALGATDYETGNPSPVYDAFVEFTHLRDLQVRVGQYFVPFDRARTMREAALEMVDRPQVVKEFTLDRDIGVMASSRDLFGTRVLGYHLFVGGGDGRNHIGPTEPGPMVVGRLVVRPFGDFEDDTEGDLARDPHPRLALGVAAAYNHDTRRVRSTYGAQFEGGDADYVHEAVDLVFKCAGFSLLAEAVARHADHDSHDFVADEETVTEWTRSGAGYLAQAGMMLTDEFQVTGRWEQLFANDHTDPTLEEWEHDNGNALAAGVNYYRNGHAFKVQGDYSHAFGGDFGAGIHLIRFALDTSF
jgi:hypothetical protein